MAKKKNNAIVNEVDNPLEQVDQFEEEDMQKERSSTNILVVDDEDIVLDMLLHVLQNEGYNVQGSTRHEDALKKITEGEADIVITDLKKVKGLELLKQTKEIDPNIDVIVMTGAASVETAVESLKSGAIDYLTKPLSIDHISIIVNKALERRVYKRHAEETLFYKRLSRIDGLTELFNYRFFQELLNMEIARADRESLPLSLIILDIDDFKIFNDKNGHPMGDAALKKVSWIIKSNSRNCDFVARYGGEEFVIILPHLDKKHAGVLATRIRKEVGKTVFDHEKSAHNGRFTISVGVSEYPRDASNKEELVEKADQALYQAKASGKNMVCIYDN